MDDKTREAWNKEIGPYISNGLYDQINNKLPEDSSMCISDLLVIVELGFEAGFKSRDAEIEKLNQDCKNLIEINNNQSKVVESRNAEIEQLSSRVAVAEGKVAEQEAEIEELRGMLRGILKEFTVNEIHWKHCPNCPDEGWFMSGTGEEPEQEQCQFCYTEQWSVFNQKRFKQALKEGK